MRHFIVVCYVAVLRFSAAETTDFVDRFPSVKAPPDYNLIVHKDAPPPRTIGDVTAVERAGSSNFSLKCGVDIVRVQFFRQDVVRIWVGWNGSFTDPASADIVVATPTAGLQASYEEKDDKYVFTAKGGTVSLVATKSPMRLSMYRGSDMVWEETVGLTLNATSTFQTLASSKDEMYFGGGMQNGRFSHRGHKIRISTGSWKDGDNPNAAPMYLSSAGYGVYRNTWKPGYYDFTSAPIVLGHNEDRFDAFYFISAPKDFKALLGQYTFITGPPFMPPIYGLGLGDSDCYHNSRHGNDTQVVEAVAAKYRELDMPGAWFLPNDGYGCGYGVGPSKFPTDFQTLDKVVVNLATKYGFATGLWSSTGLPNISREVKGSGARIFKTDVGWIGGGYKYAFNSVQLCSSGIENYSTGRRFVWTVEGWAGTHRYAVMWTGDDGGSFDYIRWQIPTFVGSGFAAQAHVSGDVDGIFGGSPETYVRDLQFKCFMTVFMVMSGWAANPDKQPWAWGEPYTSINRMYLKLKSRLTPYMYTLSRIAYDTGVPPVRALALEFPEDPLTLENNTGSSQQFMSGPYLLVAPVYRPLSETKVRDGIYLPAGEWVDYWSGAITEGPKTVDGYDVPLEKLPVYVRAGAIIPMWPEMLYAGQRPASPLTLDVYPSGKSSFDLYEDDGVTREAMELGHYSNTTITCEAPDSAIKHGGDVVLSVSGSRGSFRGGLAARSYELQFHMRVAPKEVLLVTDTGNTTLVRQQSLSGLDYVAEGWAFSTATHAGIVRVKTRSMSATSSFQVQLSSKAASETAMHSPLKSASILV
mmetsp:Transcript_28708/g.66620  ORF Transcript_28708/g.66620 Transcript_28708/m.66620 type:complete len:808 (+) Transcript_28708:73-2496(+)